MTRQNIRPLIAAVFCLAVIALTSGKSLLALGWPKAYATANILGEEKFTRVTKYGGHEAILYNVRLNYTYKGAGYSYEMTADSWPANLTIRVNPINPRQISYRQVNWALVVGLALVSIAFFVSWIWITLKPNRTVYPKSMRLHRRSRRA